MKVVLVSPYSDITSMGLRQISAVLRGAGHEVHCVFLADLASELGGREATDSYPPEVVEDLRRIAAGAGLVGVTVMTNYFLRAVQITGAVRGQASSPPVVWGGIHATIAADECLEHADFVCLGEGEGAALELAAALAAGGDGQGIANIRTRAARGGPPTPIRPLEPDLDRLPDPDYDLDDHHVWDQDAGRILALDERLLEKHLASGHISRMRHETAYQTLTTRGCPHACSYCCNSFLRQLYPGTGYLRRRSIERVIGEIERVKRRYPFIQVIGLSDDSLFATGDEEIERFAAEYSARVGLPFFCLGSPLTITERKLAALTAAGMFLLQMGIQTGSPRTARLYGRQTDGEAVLATARLIARFSPPMRPPTYDFILDNPAEDASDLRATLQLIRRLPRPHRLQLFSLVVFPGTGLYREFLARGLIEAGRQAYVKEYHRRAATYLNLVFALHRYPFPRPLLALAASRPATALLHRPALEPLYRLLYRLARAANRRFLRRF